MQSGCESYKVEQFNQIIVTTNNDAAALTAATTEDHLQNGKEITIHERRE